MKKLFLPFLFFLSVFVSCNNTDEEVSDKNPPLPDVKIEEITGSVNKEKANNEEHDLKVQLNADFKHFIDKFPHSSLPYELIPDFENDDEDIYAKIPLEHQVKYLSKAENLKKADFEEMADYTDFYYVSTPLHTNKFTAVVYGRFEMGSVYFFLCTYDNTGKLISSIDFASLELLGAGPQAGQYTITKGKIDKNQKVTVRFEDFDGNKTLENYQIKENGQIVKL